MTHYRNAMQLGEWVVTTDNSGGIGEKQDDLVAVPDQVTARFAARVVLLEQWAADAEPEAILLHNFSGDTSWDRYCEGVQDVFDEIGQATPQISGSSETNMTLQQSAIAVTMMGRQQATKQPSTGSWFTYGTPLVGEAVITRATEIASLSLLNKARQNDLIERIWPVGSTGILAEYRAATSDPTCSAVSSLDLEASAGPATVVLLQIDDAHVTKARELFGDLLRLLG